MDKTNVGALTAWDGTNFEYIVGATEKITSTEQAPMDTEGDLVPNDGTVTKGKKVVDTTAILTINVADNEGVVDGGVALAEKTNERGTGDSADFNYIANVFVVLDGDNAELIVYCNDILNVNK